MANELETKLRFILEEKLNDMKPEHIKAGINILGVEGVLETGELTTEEYNTCNNLASLILADTPIMKDTNLTMDITLDMSANDNMRVENNTLFIEEVSE